MALPFAGTVAVRAMRDGDYQATIYPGTTAGLQAAAVSVSATGGKIAIGPGDLVLTDTVSVTGNGVSIEGSGMGATKLVYSGGTTAILFATTGGVSRSHRLADLTVELAANQTGGCVQFTGGDMFWSIENVSIENPSSGYTTGTGLKLLNCQNGVVSNVTVRSHDPTKLWTIGHDIDINDAVNRGNIMFLGGMVSNFTTGTSIAASGPGNAVNNCAFYGTKWVNYSGVSKDGKVCVDINGQADETGFYSCHFESAQTGIDNDLSDSMTVIGCQFSGMSNDANSAGICIDVTSSEAAFIGPNRIRTAYNGISLNGVSKGCVVVEGRWDTISGTSFSDTSTGNRGNFYIAGASVTGTGDPIAKNLASAANITLPRGDFVTITGTAAITSITATTLDKDRKVTLLFSGNAATTGLTDGSNLKLAGNFVYTTDDTLTLICDGTNWIEVCRSVN